MPTNLEPFGPFRLEAQMDPVERVAQLRALRTIVHIHLGMIEQGEEIEAALRSAETDIGAAELALQLFDRLPTLVSRRILCTFAYIHKPLYNSARQQSRKGTANAYLDQAV